MRYILSILLPVLCVLLCSCNSLYQTFTYTEPPKGVDSLEVHEGILSQKAQRIKYKKDGRIVAIIEQSEPVLVAMADRKEPWGFFQFPSISTMNDGTLIVTWQMKEDSHKTYGKDAERKSVPMMSKDGGRTWIPRDKGGLTFRKGYETYLNDGGIIRVCTPAAKDIRSYNSFPNVVAKRGPFSFYNMKDLPEDLQGVYLNYIGKESYQIHAQIIDAGLLRYSIGNLMPIVWWGDIKRLSDNSLIAGTYPAYYLNEHGQVLPSGVSFYRTEDNGHTWRVLGKLFFKQDSVADKRGDGRFDEPTFEILADSTFICVMRTGMVSPLYRSFSQDKGKTWTIPEPITPNGVLPKLLLLKNGVLVLVSGRPGIQIRFSYDGTGIKWSDPIDMIPFMNADGTYTRDVSCGYPAILENGDNTFYIVYSDFTTKDALGRERKSIWCKKVTVIRK